MKTLLLHTAEEHADLAEWLRAHSGEADHPDGMTTAANWLTAVTVGDYPARVPVPPQAAPALEFMIADWIEVLSCHGESFETRLEP